MDLHRFSSRKRKQVRRACLNCQKAHSGCGEQRPCPRCVKRKEEHKCLDAPRRKRKDLPLDTTAASMTTAVSTTVTNKRKRKLIDAVVSAAASLKSESSHHHHKHSSLECGDDSYDSQDEDYEDDWAPSPSQQQRCGALVVRPTKRPRRSNKLHHQPAPAYASDSRLTFPFTDHTKVERKEEPEDETYAHGYVTNYNTQPGYGVMGQVQQQVLSQKLSVYNLQPQQTQQQQQHNYNHHNTKQEDTFLFNPQEFDCVMPTTERRFPTCEQSQQQQPQHHKVDDDLSLEWLLPDLQLWGSSSSTTTTTTTTFTNPYLMSADSQPASALPSSFLLDDNMGSFTTEDSLAPLFFSDYRTYEEPLFGF